MGRTGRVRAGLVVCVAAMVVGWIVTATVATARATVLDRAWYDNALTRAGAYDRLYSEVLTDPKVADLTQDLLARLPLDRSVVTANIRVVLPPATVRGLVDAQLDALLAYLKDDTGRLELVVDLRPVFDNVAALADTYLAEGVTGAPTYRAASVRDLLTGLLGGLDQLAAGRVPKTVPTFPLGADAQKQVRLAIEARLTKAQRTQTDSQLRVRLAQGDVAGALALVGPRLFGGQQRAVADLRERLDRGDRWDLGTPLERVHGSATLDVVRAIRPVAGATGWVLLASTTVAAAGLAGGALLTRRRGGRPLVFAAASLGGLGAFTLLAGLLVRLTVPDPFGPLTGAHSPVPPGARDLVGDVVAQLYGSLRTAYVRLGTGALVAGAVAAALALAPRARDALRGRRRVAALAAAVPVVLAVSWLSFPRATSDAARTCNGAAHLCGRRYDQVVYAATHNAMANSEDRFLGAAQDPDLVHQLDGGIRALLLDTHYWTPANEVRDYLATLPPATRALLAPYAARAAQRRPGTWLCHDVCQLGATDLTGQLRDLKGWLDRNPGEVVTLILQDGISEADTERAFDRAGLDGDLAVPPRPGDRWPTLGAMVASGRRLVVFSEFTDDPGGWYRNFYGYASDTPFDNRSAADLSCRLDRGTARAPLLLLNNWVTRAASSRQDASVVNAAGFLRAQIRDCVRRRGRGPTFVAVDFATIGDLTSTVAALNGTG